MGSRPKVVQQDPEGDAKKAAEKATAEANAKKAMRRVGGGSSASVLSGGDDSNVPSSGFAKQWKQFVNDKKSTLGGG